MLQSAGELALRQASDSTRPPTRHLPAPILSAPHLGVWGTLSFECFCCVDNRNVICRLLLWSRCCNIWHRRRRRHSPGKLKIGAGNLIACRSQSGCCEFTEAVTNRVTSDMKSGSRPLPPPQADDFRTLKMAMSGNRPEVVRCTGSVDGFRTVSGHCYFRPTGQSNAGKPREIS